MSGEETPRRLKAGKETIRHLFSVSGNRCAFNGCEQILVTAEGVFVANLCHIEAALPEGERFNPESSNEERRAPSNLILLCYPHHVETNDVDKFPVERMRQIKADHEAQFLDAVASIVEAGFSDVTENNKLAEPRTLESFNRILGWELEPEQLEASLDDYYLPQLRELVHLPRDTRFVLLTIIRRSEGSGELEIEIAELQEVLTLSSAKLHTHLRMLQKYGFVWLDSVEMGYEGPPRVYTTSFNGEYFWDFFKEYCEKSGLSMEPFILDLKFDLLD